jgi:hypothetical protein
MTNDNYCFLDGRAVPVPPSLEFIRAEYRTLIADMVDADEILDLVMATADRIEALALL